MKQKYLLGGALYAGSKALGANDEIANSLGVAGGIGEMLFNPAAGSLDAISYGTKLIPELMAYGGHRAKICAYGGSNGSSAGFNEYNGPNHSDGGISISDVAETEGGEAEYKGYIFSDRVKVPDSKKTFAQESKKIFSKYKNRLKDDLAIQSMEREFANLTAIQESNPEILKGREKISKKMAYGGKKKYAFGDPDPEFPILPENANPFNDELLQGYTPLESMITDSYGRPTSMPNNVPSRASLMESRSGTLATPQLNQLPPITNTLDSQPQATPGYRAEQIPDTNIPITGALMNSIGPAAQLAGTLIGGPDTTTLDRVNPNFVDYDPAVTVAERGAATSRANLRGNVANNARNSGQLLSNLVTGNTAIGRNLADTTTGIRMQESNVNTQIGNQAQAQNAGIQQQEQIANEQNKAAYRQAIYGALTDMGNIGAGYTRDNALLDAQTLMNQRTLNMLSGLPSRYTIDANGNLVIK